MKDLSQQKIDRMKEIKVLLVDDEVDVIDTFETFFEDYTLQTFIRSEKAYDAILKESFHFIFLDIYMPGMDGLELCRKTRQSVLNKNAYIYAYTWENRQAVQAKFFEAGLDDVIEKTVDPEIIKMKMNADMLREKRSRVFQNTSELQETEEDFLFNNMPLRLTRTEFKLLKVLVENKGNPLKSSEIYNFIKGKDTKTDSSTVREHIMNIRNKFRKLDSTTNYLDNNDSGYFLKNC
jgi:DNA-binding response OmpR family regulator